MSRLIQTPVDQQIAALVTAGDIDRAARVAIDSFGPEVLTLLVALLGDEVSAKAVHVSFPDALRQSFATYRGECTPRTWSYLIGNHLAQAHIRRTQVGLPPSTTPARSEVVAAAATIDGLERARAALSSDDRALLVMRVDRSMSWAEVAQVFLGPELACHPSVVAKKSAYLRKRYERLPQQLKAKLSADGTNGTSSEGSGSPMGGMNNMNGSTNGVGGASAAHAMPSAATIAQSGLDRSVSAAR